MEMEIEIKEHTPKGLVKREVISAGYEDDQEPILRLKDIMESYPAHEISNMSFYAWGHVTIFLKRKGR